MNLMNQAVRLLPLAGAIMLSACGGGGSDAQPPKQASQTIAVGEPAPVPSPAAFIAMAQKESCADTSNRLFVIDQKYVFWERAGSCADNSYAMRLYNVNPESPLCTKADSIAGPLVACNDIGIRGMFETITTDLYKKVNLGLDASHKVEEIKLPVQNAPIVFSTIAQASFSGISQPRTVVVKDAAALEALWREHEQAPTPAPVPKVDFDTHMVIGVFAGYSSGCHEFSIRSIGLESGKVVVAYEDRDINPVAVCVAVVTAPMQLVTIPRTDAPVDFVKIAPEHLTFTQLLRSDYSNINTPQNLVVRDDAAWRALWARHVITEADPPRVDFGKQMVLAVFGGGGTNGCASSRVEQVYLARGRINVESIHSSPKPGNPVICTQALTNPANFIVVDKSDLPVVFSAQTRYW